MLGRRCVELIGDADVLRPWGWDPAGSQVKAEVGWIVQALSRAGQSHGLLSQRRRPRACTGRKMIKAGLVTFGVVGLFFAGVPVAKAAILGGALLLVYPRHQGPARSIARSTARCC